MRWNPCCRVTMLAGFRWVNLRENLVGALEPPTISQGTAFLEYNDDEQSLWFPDRRGWEDFRARPLFDRRAGKGRDFRQQRGRDDRSQRSTRSETVVRFDQPRRLRRRNRLAVQVSSHRASCAKGRLRSDLAARRCLGAGTDSGNLYLLLANERAKHWASIATPACFITAPPPAWNIHFRASLEMSPLSLRERAG